MIPQLKNPYTDDADDPWLTEYQRDKAALKASVYTQGWVDLEKAIEPKIKELLQLLELQKHILNRGAFSGEIQELTNKMIKILKP